ncbi:MAG TPA: transposase [Acidobacteriaceae bacterium]
MAKVRTPRPGMSYVTTATSERRPIFEISRVAEMFIDTLLHYRTLGHYKLHAYVVMPDHVHLVLTPQSITLGQAIGLIKSGFSHRLDTQLPVWENTYTAYSVANNHDLEVVRAYLHQLPVRANLAAAAELYPFSSAHRQAVSSLPISVPAEKSPSGSVTIEDPATSLDKIAS